MIRGSRWLSHSAKRTFQVPKTYKADVKLSRLPFSRAFEAWRKSLQGDRLQTLQDELLELMLPSKTNSEVIKVNQKVPIDNNGNYINELKLSLINDPSYDEKNIVFVHGYGASLGCFARNFELINQLKDQKFNYNIYFLDNITCGLSSNPTIDNPKANEWFLFQTPKITMIGDGDGKIHKKYYKAPDEYSIKKEEFNKYKDHYVPILKDMETFYTNAIDQWRSAKGIPKLDFLVGHSFGGYWSGSYALRNPDRVLTLVLLSPVGVERHIHAVTNDVIPESKTEMVTRKPSLSAVSYDFLSRWPLLLKSHIRQWYYILPFFPRFLRWLGPWGYIKYFKMWYSKLFKVNMVVNKKGGLHNVFKSSNELVYGTNRECMLLVEYLFNAISRGSHSDIYVKNLLTPSTVSKHPLFDKFNLFLESSELPFDLHVVYGQYDFMNSEAGEHLVHRCNAASKSEVAQIHKVAEGGHNLYIDNPFDTNRLLAKVVTELR